MNYWIESIPINIFGGKFNTTVEFKNGLNIISGVNGTGKTELLKLLKSNQSLLAENPDNKRTAADVNVFAISPKRNTEKKTIDTILDEYKTQSKSPKKFLETIRSLTIKDSGFENYSSFAEIFVIKYRALADDGKTSYEVAIKKTEENFNRILDRVFPGYKIIAKWLYENSTGIGKLSLQVQKKKLSPINIESLSTGEREVFALLFNIFTSRDDEDIYLIDEPEIHLNWNLEKGLFSFLKWFCEKYEKQVIVTTHSRIIFQTDFIERVQFFIWENNRIKVRNRIPEEERIKIAGEATEFLRVVQLPKKTFFVEDKTHQLVLKILSEKTETDIDINVCGNKSTVISLFKLTQKGSGEWKNSYFLVDGDNEGIAILNDRFIVLSKYCIENYFFNIQILSEVLLKTEEEIKSAILDSIKEKATSSSLLVYKKLAELSGSFPFEILDFFDCAILIKHFAEKFQISKETLIKKYIEQAAQEEKLDSIFGEVTTKFT